MDTYDEFILECHSSKVLQDELMLERELLEEVVGPIVKYSTGDSPVSELREFLSSPDMSTMLRLDTESEECVQYLAYIANACMNRNVTQFEDAIGMYTDFLTESMIASMTSPLPDMDAVVRGAIERYAKAEPAPQPPIPQPKAVVEPPVSKTTTPIAPKRVFAPARSTPVPKKAHTPVPVPVVVPSPVVVPVPAPAPARTKAKRAMPLQAYTQKNTGMYLTGVAAKIAEVRSIDVNNLKGLFRSAVVLETSELVKTIRSLPRMGALDYIRSVFPVLDNMNPIVHDLIVDDMHDRVYRPGMRGLSSVILNYETQLKDLMVASGVGHVARILAIGQARSSFLDAPVVKSSSVNAVRYKRKAILHEDVRIADLRELEETIKICGNNTVSVYGLIKDRVVNVLKHIQNIKTQDNVDRHNRGVGIQSQVFSGIIRYEKHLSTANIARFAYIHSHEHHSLVAGITGRPSREVHSVYTDYDSVVDSLLERRKQVDLWAVGNTGRAIHQKDYIGVYQGYYKQLEEITSSLNNESIRLNCETSDMLSKICKQRLPPIVRQSTKGGATLPRINLDAIPVRNTQEGKRYITLSEPLPDFSTAVARSAELVKYETDGKTTKQVTESLSQVIASMSTARSVDGDDLRRLGQILHELSTRS